MGYAGKLLGSQKTRVIGRHSFGALLGVLGCKLILAEDAEALVRYSSRAQKRKFQVHARDTMLAKRQPGFSRFSGDSEWGEMMQKRWVLNVGPRRRKRIARTAAKARWAKHRAIQAAAGLKVAATDCQVT